MHILLVADGRSPITRNWIKVLQPLGYRIDLVSTYPSEPVEGAEIAAVLPVAFARFGGSQAGTNKPASEKKNLISRFRPLLARLRHQLGPWTLILYRKKFQKIVESIKPDLVHAMRIPYEGMLASATPPSTPMVISTWGNDFTLHAPANALLSRLTRQTMQRADGILSDTRRDVSLAQQWGFDAGKPALVVVGNGGLDLEAMARVANRIKRAESAQIINPRGLRSYVRSDTFFKAIPLVLAKHPQVQFVCASMAGQKEALEWVEKLGIAGNVKLLPFLSQAELWEQFARSTISVSISEHDGTPNTMLEAMALGCLPVCGDLESIREWIEPEVNGYLVNPDSAEEIASAINAILDDPGKFKKWIENNHQIIIDRADRKKLQTELDSFYKKFVK